MFQTTYYVPTPVNTDNIETNITTTHPKSVDIQLALYNIFIPLISVIIIVINTLIVISSGLILHRGQQPRSTYIFLGNVALSDLLIGVATLFGQYYPYIYDEIICSVTIGMIVSSTISSVYSIGLIAIDRYLYILYGLQYQRYISSNRARIMSIMTWILGIIIGFLPAMGFRNFTNNGRLCWYIILVPRELVLITTTIGIIPLITIIVLYSIILKHALNKINELKSAASNTRGTLSGELRLFRGGQQQQQQPTSHSSVGDEIITEHYEQSTELPIRNSCSRNKFANFFRKKEHTITRPKILQVYNPSKWKAIKVVLFTTGSYFITWFPFFLASSLFAFCNPKKTPRYCDNLRIAIASPLLILGLINSILNPIIYAWWHNGFRETVKKIYYGIFSKPTNSESSSSANTNRTSTRTIGNSGNNCGVTSGSELETTELDQRIRRPKHKKKSSINRQNKVNSQIVNTFVTSCTTSGTPTVF